tara:strand:+ start:56 stop:478 length:423 start_codon:yes stop_codon:yes gene_type:complete
MILPIHSQTISRGEIKETVNSNGDTLVIMHLEDARVILNDLLEYEVVDSLLTTYKEKDSLNTSKIEIQKDIIFKLVEKNNNQQTQINNFQQILDNLKSEIVLKEDTIKQQKKEIRKQKLLKLTGFTSSIILPILTLLALL